MRELIIAHVFKEKEKHVEIILRMHWHGLLFNLNPPCVMLQTFIFYPYQCHSYLTCGHSRKVLETGLHWEVQYGHRLKKLRLFCQAKSQTNVADLIDWNGVPTLPWWTRRLYVVQVKNMHCPEAMQRAGWPLLLALFIYMYIYIYIYMQISGGRGQQSC